MAIITISGRRVKRLSVIPVSERQKCRFIRTRQAKALAPWAGSQWALTEAGYQLTEAGYQLTESGEAAVDEGPAIGAGVRELGAEGEAM